MKMFFGRYAGKEVSELAAINSAYLCWCLREIPDLDPALRENIRLALGLPAVPAKTDSLRLTPDVKDKIVRRFTRILATEVQDEALVGLARGVLESVLRHLDRQEQPMRQETATAA